MTLLEELKARGLVEAVTDPEIEKLLETPQTVYCGFDPSAASLQAGNLVSIMVLRRFQQAGHKVIALVGGATGLIGDPSGKSAERNMREPFAHPRLRRTQRRHPRGQLRLVQGHERDRVPARHRHQLPRPADAREGEREEAPRGERGRAHVHRVQLPDPPGQRLPPPLRHVRLRDRGGWRGPVGQHHGRH